MGDPIPNTLWKIWDDCNIRGFILLSLSLQTFLILCAPLRKRTSSMWITSLIWTAYLLADWVASFTIGLIVSSQRDKGHDGNTIDVRLLAFWSSFLLIHLGGPDTISSFSLQDNDLWLRHLVGLLFQVVATLYVFLISLGATNNYKLWFPTLVLFLTGIIKYAERTRALYLGSMDGLKNSVKEDEKYERYRGHTTFVIAHHPFHKNINIGVVQCAYDFFESFSKGLIADLLFTTKDSTQWDCSHFFWNRSAEQSFHLIAAELNLIYETLFTKLYVAHTKLGYFFRAMSFGATSIALVCFYTLDKHGLHRFDVVITYTLICGAMALDSIALFMLIFSDWTVAAAQELLSKDSWQSSCVTSILLKYIDLKSPKWYSSKTRSSFLGWSRQILFGRCSESIYTLNLIDYVRKESSPPTSVIGHSCRIFYLKTIGLFRGCLQYFRQPSSGDGGVVLPSAGDGGRVEPDPTQVLAPKWGSFFGLKDLLDNIKYRSSKPLSKDLWEFIFNEIREKKNSGEGMFELWDARGNWILRYNHSYGDCTGLLRYATDLDYEESLIVWHIATELCYNKSKSNAGVDNRRREYSKTLSEYMLYLLFMQPNMMSSVTKIGADALLVTCAFAKIFFSQNSEPRVVLEHEEACKRILQAISPSIREKYRFYTPVRKPVLLFLACDLALELAKLEDKKWDLMSQMWVELLSYAASHCRPNSYAQLLSKGGELVAFVWLVMVHLQVRPT